jgi:hypothetical protein
MKMFSFIILTFTFEEIKNKIFEKYGICSVILHLNKFFKKKEEEIRH